VHPGAEMLVNVDYAQFERLAGRNEALCQSCQGKIAYSIGFTDQLWGPMIDVYRSTHTR
jgi:hypothetical protein